MLGDGDGDLTGIDLDGCVKDGKIVDKEIALIVAISGSYAEISPSGFNNVPTDADVYVSMRGFKVTMPSHSRNRRPYRSRAVEIRLARGH